MRKFVLAAVAATVFCAPPVLAGTYTFAGVTFEQDSTPDVLAFMPSSSIQGGASFGAGNVTTITGSVAFVASSVGGGGVITPQAGFDPALSLGRQGFAQLGIDQDGAPPALPSQNCHYACAINMPAGNNGTTIRQGIEVSWSGGRTLGNAGVSGDFVIYESGSPGSPEGFMVRVRNAETQAFSDWRYEVADGSEFFLSSTREVAFATLFDLTDFGLGSDDAIDLIQIANLIAADRVSGGFVQFDGSGSSHGFASGSLDPDPLYVGILHALNSPTAVDAPSALAAFGVGLAALGLFRRRRRD